MGEVVKQYITWKIVASAVCIIVFTMAGSLWSANSERLRNMDLKIDNKVDIKRYEADMQRVESKLDMLINMHMADRPYKRVK
jgi:hypothetical protein